jgi:hypothetical protein
MVSFYPDVWLAVDEVDSGVGAHGRVGGVGMGSKSRGEDSSYPNLVAFRT